jgi:hypothetical protein
MSTSRHNRGLKNGAKPESGGTLDYRVDFLGESQNSSAWFKAEDDSEAFKKALIFYKIRAVLKGFRLWQRSRLVYSEPAQQ